MIYQRGRQSFEEWEHSMLAPYAVRSTQSRGRRYSEPEHDYRTLYQRDRDRIIHSRAFRRLEYKTQVFVNHEGDYYRTRLTHTLEVSQIARTIARVLMLNEDLAEAICLAHDLGHTPFGHSGEAAMNELMKEVGGFEHNRQSFRVVTCLEDRYPDFPGLNLTHEVLEGLTKHGERYTFPDGDRFVKEGAPTFEAQICDFADEIAYNNHDIDDGLKSGVLTLEALQEAELWKEHFEQAQAELPQSTLRMQCLQTVRRMINALALDLIGETLRAIEARDIRTLEDIREKGAGAVSFSPEMKRKNAALKRCLFKHMYRHYRVERMAMKATRVIRGLFQAYMENTKTLPPQFYELLARGSPERVVCDYIAGMTDRFALSEYKKLFDPFEKV